MPRQKKNEENRKTEYLCNKAKNIKRERKSLSDTRRAAKTNAKTAAKPPETRWKWNFEHSLQPHEKQKTTEQLPVRHTPGRQNQSQNRRQATWNTL